ncbi:hypothetical protein [Pseudomonas chlororaphis]|uniref:hypothetical protein n=1 Tax=Pseudomonas chlororaphis TaxID=587753 RepID=UPI0009BBADA6|nr:hypothetical protein [Pseudomonas chlororaphis]
MKKTMSPLFSPIQLSTNMNERIGNTTIGEAIARNHELLQEHFFEPLLGHHAHTKLLNDISAVTNDLALQAELELTWDGEINEYDEETNTTLKHAQYACLYIELARAAEAGNEHVRAWAFNNHASLMVGEILEKTVAIQSRTETKKRSKQNSENGQGRNKSTLLLRKEAARLLMEKRPEAGWPTKVKAVTDLEEPLTEFIEKNKILSPRISNIERWLTAWLREDELVNPAWEKNKHTNAR